MAEILKISQASSLAFHSLLLLARQPEKKFSTPELARKLKVSEAHLSKVLQTLVRSGFLKAERGPAGGYQLAKSPERITLLEVYQAIEGRYQIRKCLLEKKICFAQQCLFQGLIEELNKEIKDYLRQTRLQDLTVLEKGGKDGKKKASNCKDR